MKVGDTVTYVGPSLFESGCNWTGKVVRMPLKWEKQTRKMRDTRVLVQRSGEVRSGNKPVLRPVRPEHLRVVAAKPDSTAESKQQPHG